MPLSATGRPSAKRIETVSGRDDDVVAPERDAHDRLDDLDALVQEFEVFRLVRRAQHVRIGRVRLLGAHLVAEAGAVQVFRHLLAAAQLVDERRVEPRLVDAQTGVRQEPVAVEALDVVALERAAVAPDVDVVLAHRDHEHRARNGAPQRRRVEVAEAPGGNVERPRLQCRDSLGDERRTAIDEARGFRAVGARTARNLVVVRLVRLAEVRGVRVRDRALRAHPVQRGARVETAGKRDADFLADRKILQDVRHVGTFRAVRNRVILAESSPAGATSMRGSDSHDPFDEIASL